MNSCYHLLRDAHRFGSKKTMKGLYTRVKDTLSGDAWRNALCGLLKLYAIAYPSPVSCNAYYDPEKNQFINSCLGTPSITELVAP